MMDSWRLFRLPPSGYREMHISHRPPLARSAELSAIPPGLRADTALPPFVTTQYFPVSMSQDHPLLGLWGASDLLLLQNI